MGVRGGEDVDGGAARPAALVTTTGLQNWICCICVQIFYDFPMLLESAKPLHS